MSTFMANKSFEYRISVNSKNSQNLKNFMVGNEVNQVDAEHLFDDDVLDKSAIVNSVDLNEQCNNLMVFDRTGKQFVRVDAFDDKENYDDFEISVSVEPSAFQEEIDGHAMRQNNGVGIVFGYEGAGDFFKLEWIANEFSCSSDALNELRLVKVENYEEIILAQATLIERPSYRTSSAFSEKVKMAVKVNRSKKLIIGITSYAEIICTNVDTPKINDFGLFSWDNEIGLVFEELSVNEYLEK